MTATPQKPSLADRAPMWRPEIAGSILSAVAGIKPPMAKKAPGPRITMSDILRMVVEETRVSKREMCGESRFDHMVRARMIYSALCRRYTKASFPMIGRSISRDHTTIISAVRQVQSSPQRFEPELSRIASAIETGRGQDHA